MSTNVKKIILIVVAIFVLEIPVFLLWNWYSGSREESAQLKVSAETAAPAETLPLPTVQPTLPEETTEPTVPETTMPETTVPEETEPKRPSIDAVPQYFMNDYPDEPYSFSNVAQSGSSMTALAMVATYMTDYEYYPDQMADWLAHFLGGDYQRLEYGSDLLGLAWKRAENIHEAVRAVEDGKTVIVMFNKDNLFTWKEHYVVLTGMNDAGKILLLDTDRENYEKNFLKQYYEGGFTDKDLMRKYSAAWIYDKDQMPEDPEVYAPEPAPDTSRYPGLELTDEERNLIAKLICMEAASEPFEGQQAVAEVIFNRLASGRFQNSIHNIIYADGQFPSVDYLYKAKPDYSQYKAIEQALNGPYVLPEDVVFYAKFKINDNLWGQIGSHYFCYKY